MASGMPKSAGPALAGLEFVYQFKIGPYHRHDDHLRDTLARLYLVALGAAIPTRDIYLPLVVRVDEAGQVAEHEAMLVAKT